MSIHNIIGLIGGTIFLAFLFYGIYILGKTPDYMKK